MHNKPNLTIVLALIGTLASAPPVATADGLRVATIFLDTWDVAGSFYVNVTTSIHGGVGAACELPLIGVEAKKDGKIPAPLGPGSSTRIGATQHYYRNMTVASGYDSFAVVVEWTSDSPTCVTSHKTTASFRAGDLYVTNNNQTTITNNGGASCDGGCVSNPWYNDTFDASVNTVLMTHDNDGEINTVATHVLMWSAAVGVVIVGLVVAKAESPLFKWFMAFAYVVVGVTASRLDMTDNLHAVRVVMVVLAYAFAAIFALTSLRATSGRY